MDVASMGWIAVGIGRLTLPSKSLPPEDVADAEEVFLVSASLPAPEPLEPARALSFSFFFTSFFSAFSAVNVFLLFLSNLAIAPASQGAFTAPRDAGRLLVQCFEAASPAISAMVRPV